VQSYIVKKELSAATEDKVEAKKKRIKAMCFTQWADATRYGDILEDLRRGVHRGHDEYPKTVAAAYALLIKASKMIGYRRSRSNNKGRSAHTNNIQNFVLVFCFAFLIFL